MPTRRASGTCAAEKVGPHLGDAFVPAGRDFAPLVSLVPAAGMPSRANRVARHAPAEPRSRTALRGAVRNRHLEARPRSAEVENALHRRGSVYGRDHAE